MKIERISIFMPKDTSWYRGLIKQMARAFSSFDLEVSFYCGLLDEVGLMEWIDKFNPQVIFEMNRSRNEVPFLPKNILHICWIVDFGGRDVNDFQGSEITYLFGSSWVERFCSPSLYRLLCQGTSTSDYSPRAFDHKVDVSFIGHIPSPWKEEELNRNISASENELLFGEFICLMTDAISKNRESLVVTEDYIRLANDLASDIFGVTLRDDLVIKYDVSGRVIRQIYRHELAEELVNLDKDLHFYGPDNWAKFSKYRDFYKGFLHEPSEMNEVYASSYINCHDGIGMHFRVLDCMSSSGLLFYRKSVGDQLDGGIQNYFEPGVHYVEFHIEELSEKVNYYMNNSKTANKIRVNAALEVEHNHTWEHRVRSILVDIEQF